MHLPALVAEVRGESAEDHVHRVVRGLAQVGESARFRPRTGGVCQLCTESGNVLAAGAIGHDVNGLAVGSIVHPRTRMLRCSRRTTRSRTADTGRCSGAYGHAVRELRESLHHDLGCVANVPQRPTAIHVCSAPPPFPVARPACDLRPMFSQCHPLREPAHHRVILRRGETRASLAHAPWPDWRDRDVSRRDRSRQLRTPSGSGTRPSRSTPVA
jgi:hypothetical protein